ncbi:histidinol-phosphate transaminase [Tenacibaculum sp. SG-28]|uniref:histidinol-phosphate transaminase n=1 Tax=Tenacibaculum sp. SG-28 TaxID=754426 RepID=UPI000CF4BDD5|nr:histidinol-phosphate transaminase [Tenacibaculum sp. SG-28]PQJ23472.1 histidinol-phosphate transaminase [Tenacibaculum sp. SG-28]
MFNLQKIVRSNISRLQAYASARDEFKGVADVYLDANENPFGELNRYPDPKQSKIKKILSGIKNVAENQIFIGNGSDEVIDLAFRIFCNPGVDKALTFTPSYGMYKVSAGINDVELIELPLTASFTINLEEVSPYLADENLKLIFICSPNNPTGNCFSEESITWILNNFNGIVIIDEAYIDFSTKASFISKLEKYPNLIISQTFSKAWGLAGARTGVAYASKELIALYNKVKPPYNVSALNQDAVYKALHNLELFEVNKRVILQEKEDLIFALQSINYVKTIFPSEANFILVEVEDAYKVYHSLVQLNIITRNRSNLIANCIRITVGSPRDNEQLITAMQKIV